MLISNEKRLDFLGKMSLFRSLEPEELPEIASILEEHLVPEGELLYRQGDRADNFYLLYSGELQIRASTKSLPEGQALGSGDTFGSKALLNGAARYSTIHSSRDSLILYLPKRSFFELISRHPSIAEKLTSREAAEEMQAEIDFDWLHEDETLHHVLRKHIAYLWTRFSKPIVVLILSLLAINTSINAPAAEGQFNWLWLGAAGSFFAVVWALWEFFDWRNDYYIITDRRVVWLEHMLLRSSSRKEAPLSAIQQVNVHTSQLARLMKFGDVIVRTYTGTVLMPAVPNPHFVKEIIEEYADRDRDHDREERHESIRKAVRESLGKSTGEPSSEEIEVSEESHMVDPGERFQLFKTRHVDGEVVTYHRHWFVLFSRMLFPAFFIVAIVSALNFLYGGFPTDTQSWLIAIAFITLPILVMLYRFLDWQNDIYQVTAESLIDSEKKPLGSEVTKSASLSNILSLENHRIGLLGLILNYGEVRINIGDTSLDFTDVHNPALIQQDIFIRMEALKSRADHSRDEEERTRIAEWLQVYEEERNSEIDPENEQLE